MELSEMDIEGFSMNCGQIVQFLDDQQSILFEKNSASGVIFPFRWIPPTFSMDGLHGTAWLMV